GRTRRRTCGTGARSIGGPTRATRAAPRRPRDRARASRRRRPRGRGRPARSHAARTPASRRPAPARARACRAPPRARAREPARTNRPLRSSLNEVAERALEERAHPRRAGEDRIATIQAIAAGEEVVREAAGLAHD